MILRLYLVITVILSALVSFISLPSCLLVPGAQSALHDRDYPEHDEISPILSRINKSVLLKNETNGSINKFSDEFQALSELTGISFGQGNL